LLAVDLLRGTKPDIHARKPDIALPKLDIRIRKPGTEKESIDSGRVRADALAEYQDEYPPNQTRNFPRERSTP
jgi:hypothetical protein